jgi:hypothetical protein
MNRRSFLSLFGSAAAVAVTKPTYFFAPVGGWPRKTYSFSDVRGLYMNSWIASRVDDDYKRMLREMGLVRRKSQTPRVVIYQSIAEVERNFGPP